MKFNNIIRDEKDILVETYIRAKGLITDIENLIKQPLTQNDKKNLISIAETEINNILNIAFNNTEIYNYLQINDYEKSMPDNYFKPDKEYMDLLKIAYKMNNQQFQQLIKSAKGISNK